MVEERTSSLQSEIRQTRPFVSRAQEAAVAILKTADAVRRQISETLEPYGITPQQYNVLRILRGAGESGLPTLEIAVRMIERAPGITGLLDRLEAKEMIRRDRKSGDRRCVVCRITGSGLELLVRLDGPVDRADQLLFGTVNDADLQHFLDTLQTVRNGASGTDAASPSHPLSGIPPGLPKPISTTSGLETPRKEKETP